MQPSEVPSPAKPRPASSGKTKQLVISLLVCAVIAAVAAGYFFAAQSGQAANGQAVSTTPQQAVSQRPATVAAAGAQVMPFDLSKTTHVFADAPSGGIEVVTADDPNDSSQISLIRTHLQHEADNFSKGDFSDPAATHSNDMPGLAELERGVGRFTVSYKELADGAQLTYTSSDPALITALHQWFEAQRTDHGAGSDMNGMNMDANATPTP